MAQMLDVKKVRSETLTGRKLVTLIAKKKNGSLIKAGNKAIKNIVQSIEKDAQKQGLQNVEIQVKGLRIDGTYTTLKSFKENVNMSDILKYYQGRVANDAKFAQLNHLEIRLKAD